MNRRLLDFEAELGTKLFTRLRHGLRLTPAGEVVAAHVRATIDDGALVADRLRGIDGAVCGPVAIASAESAAMAFLPSIMASTQERFPDLTFVLAVGPPAVLVAQLLAGHADLMLTHEEPSHGDIAVLASASQPFCAVMRAGHPLASHASLLIEDCLAYPTVIAQEDLAARALFDAAIAASARHRKPSLVTNLFEAMKRFVALSDAVSFQFHLRAGEAARDGLVAVPLANRHLVAGRLWLATQRGRVLPPGASEVARRIEAWLTG